MNRAALLLPLATLLAGGCGGGAADLAGTVTFRGKPVVYGTVVVADGVPKSGKIRPDGTYRVAGVRTGPAKVAVSSPAPPGAGPARPAGKGRDADDDDKIPSTSAAPADPAAVRGWVRMPDTYGDPDKSGLTAEVGAAGPHDIALK